MFRSLVSTIFISIIAILIILLGLHTGNDNRNFLLIARDTSSPASPTHLTFVNSTLSWTAPTQNTDGTSLKDLEGYKVHYGTESKKYEVSYDVKNVTTWKVDDLVDWRTYYFVVTAYDTSGNESPYSEEIYFKKVPSKHTLAVHKEGTSKGVVLSYPEGVDCGLDCDEGYYSGTVVRLMAIPDTESFFAGWSGGGCSGRGQCILSINADTIVTATFNEEVKKEIKKDYPEPQKHSVVTTELNEKTKKEIKEDYPQPRKPLEVIFTIQVGAFKNVSYAETLVAYLKGKGYDAYMIVSGAKKEGKLFKVCIGKFTDREKAKTLSEKVRNSEGLQTFITPLQP